MINLQAFKESTAYHGHSSNYEPRASSNLLLNPKAPT